MDCSDSSSTTNNDTSVDLEWQLDSEWINLSSMGTKAKRGKKLMKETTDIPQEFEFIHTSSGSRCLVIEKQTLRLVRRSQSGHSYWVCSIPCCPARCILDPTEKMIIRYCGEHNHDPEVSRAEYKNFIHSLKRSVKENPHCKPKELYDVEVKKSKERLQNSNVFHGNEDEIDLPSFETVRTAMYNTRNAMFSMKPAGSDESPKDKTSPGSRSTRSRDSTKSASKRKSSPSKSASSTDQDELVST